MASPILFPIDDIDLSAQIVGLEEIKRLNPHRGAMRHLDRVIWQEDNWVNVLGLKEVREDEFWVPGHVPGRPLLPGVLMIEATAQLASVAYRKKRGETRFLGFTRCDKVVFRGQVPPGSSMYLLVHEINLNPRRFVADAQAVVNGAIVFEAQITGMVM